MILRPPSGPGVPDAPNSPCRDKTVGLHRRHAADRLVSSRNHPKNECMRMHM